ncbi:GAF domain-containing protein [Geodermatophilus bullaregiensis]|uniref:GAF and ANTAR domain-containing protein n=1 Tax=Geodermatophilus bullaregiensis TaxID=1564160 RepID=UPI00195B3B63|nr:GAF and ANTAR domain-containing protein [Geodermatophilus bullaregiensis]MBM7808644.1 GAF domain-containing protein [Geodermatophilus bullaregiensis]
MADSQPHPVTAAEALERLGRVSLREHSMESLLRSVVGLTKAVMPGHTEASITLLVQDRPTTVVHTDQLALDLDERQYERGHGPCLHAARTGELTEVPDTRTDSRWPDYMPRAVTHGNLSSLSVPLAIDEDEQVAGALNVYAREPHAFDEDSRRAATRFAPYAAVAAGDMHAYRSALDRADALQAALESRAVIDQAKGILMGRHRWTPDKAFHVLARTAMTTRTTIGQVADAVVRTGRLPLP